ncbi:MAG: RseA family anti-sigma factor [Pseudomonadota bacterium]|nr:RseA family anti-sigma factor [Pseudomonadota bacterium]
MESQPSKNIKEQLSAFLDGELSLDELQLLLKRLNSNSKHRDTLTRYSAIGSILRNERSKQISTEFQNNLLQNLNRETFSLDKLPNREKPFTYKPAFAAIFAFIVLTGLFSINFFLSENLYFNAGSEIKTLDLASNDRSAELEAQIDSRDPTQIANEERMLSYLVSHREETRSFQGPIMDSRVFVQQANFEE